MCRTNILAACRALGALATCNTPANAAPPPDPTSRLAPGCCAAEMIATEQQMKDARIDVAYRDYCAHLLIPLNECRHRTMYLPWKCGHERHEYEKCEYGE